MSIVRRLVPGLAAILAGGLGYLYATYAPQVREATPRMVLDAADPPRAPAPTPVALEQAAYTMATELDGVKASLANVERDVGMLLARLPPLQVPQIPPVPVTWPYSWITVVAYAPPQCPRVKPARDRR